MRTMCCALHGWATGVPRCSAQGRRYWWNFMLISYLFIFYGSIMCYHFHSIDLMWFAVRTHSHPLSLSPSLTHSQSPCAYVCVHFSRRSLWFAYACDFFFFFSLVPSSPSSLSSSSMSFNVNEMEHHFSHAICHKHLCMWIVCTILCLELSCDSIICFFGCWQQTTTTAAGAATTTTMAREKKMWKSTRVHSRWHG